METLVYAILTLIIGSGILALVISLVIVIKDKIILKERNLLYQQFVADVTFKNFMKLLEETSPQAIDLPICLMLQKYLSKTLTNINLHLIPSLLIDVKNSKHAEVLQKELLVVVVKFEVILGLSLAMADKDGSEVIRDFIDRFLPEEVRKMQYKIASNQLEEKLANRYYDHPLDFKKEIKDKIAEFTENAK